jgi:hypothetical protein
MAKKEPTKGREAIEQDLEAKQRLLQHFLDELYSASGNGEKARASGNFELAKMYNKIYINAENQIARLKSEIARLEAYLS